MPLPKSAPTKASSGKKVSAVKPISVRAPRPVTTNPLVAAAETDSDDDVPARPPAAQPLVMTQPIPQRKSTSVFDAAGDTGSESDGEPARPAPTSKSADANQMVQLAKPKARAAPAPAAVPDNGIVTKKGKAARAKQTNAEIRVADKSNLDDLFSGLKKSTKDGAKKAAKTSAADTKTQSNTKIKGNQDHHEDKEHDKAQSPPPGDDDMGWLGDTQQTRKKTEEGFSIYTYEELRFEEGGGTPDCPFDCECCIA